MCLKVKEKFIAEKDILVYKLGYVSQKSKNVYISLYRGAWIPFNELYRDPLYYPVRLGNKICYINETPYIFEGFLHACTNVEKANKIIEDEFLRFDGDPIGVKIFKAIIPKGSVGYYGENEDICSNKIIILNPELDSYKKLPDKYQL